MKKPVFPVDEANRLQSLRALQILDTDAEERFDRLTRLAQRMFDVPIALVSLVDANRQWFKSAAGLDAPETPRDISFCGHAILGDHVFTIPDASQDLRFSDNPLVTGEPNIRFYAGCPLKGLDGSKLGTLCLIDRKPRTMTPEDIKALQDLAEMAEQELVATQLATLDDLTMISNRRGFTLLANKALQMCTRNGLSATLLYLDLNNFKAINDTHGHCEGDRALLAFTELLKSTFRDSDIFARLGGDEFCILLTGTNASQAEDSIARLRNRTHDFNERLQENYLLNFSAGVLEIDLQQPDCDIDALLCQADRLMYHEKQSQG